MQSIRFLIFLFTCMLVLSSLLIFGPARSVQQQELNSDGNVGAYFNWRTPSSLFPPSAVISLTDDNSTFFLARPAAFGPDLPVKSLSGQLWIGSGFGDDHVGRTGGSGKMEGELGCSDVPGWSETGSYRSSAQAEKKGKKVDGVEKIEDAATTKKTKRSRWSLKRSSDKTDGTDDYLSPASKQSSRKDSSSSRSKGSKSTHADIQSLQESAEIAGKVALLSRGGCGFLDKVEWAQRRGAVAVIIGDDVRGGPLVTMYARGDTSNISIPALFTSHTTAHLLSSLMPTGGRQRFMSPKKGVNVKQQRKHDDTKEAAFPADSSESDGAMGWFWSLFSRDDLYGRPTINRKPADGTDWIEQTDFDDDDEVKTTSTAAAKATSSKAASTKPTDGFIIGVQDWRDPDLVPKTKNSKAQKLREQKAAKKAKAADSADTASSTPQSGEYAKPAKATKGKMKKTGSGKQKSDSWLGLLRGQKEPTASSALSNAQIIDSNQPVSNPAHLHDIHIPGAMEDEPSEHEGLWVTLSATSMSNSPFFDTLLVLVVSPLVTLTVVYALLLLRSRIRRRRWRAPKSVVERLPVRTYQTMPSTSVSSISSSISTPPSINTPLLSSARPIMHRPRSRTEADMPSSSNTQSLDPTEEKREAGLAEWRRKYGGKQKECVVCLEEYVDGVSRVMSLPCGHEFHEGCITPWLTTRRRTCPICKGDVVRSCARSANSTSSAPINDMRNEDDETVQAQAVLLTNDDPDSLRPISRGSEEFEDLERGFNDRNR